MLLRSPGHINGSTDAIPPWAPWLDTVDLAQATPGQLATLDEMSPTVRQSPCFLLLAHQPEIQLHRSVAFDAIMFASDAVALFAWANRLMLNLGEAVLSPGPSTI